MNDNTRNKETYDAYAKQLLSRKSILIHILKFLIPDFKDLDINDIKQYIEDGNNSDFIFGLANEDTSMNSQKIIFDIYFKVISPIDNKTIYINIEPQYYDAEYEIEKRGEYYLSRMIDTQKGKEFLGSDYNELKDVYSIWLMLKPNITSNYIVTNDNRLYIHKYDLKENKHNSYINKTNKSVFNEIYVYTKIIDDYHTYNIFTLMCLLFMYDDTNMELRQTVLKNDYGIIGIGKELSNMCSLAEGIERNAIQKGILEGKIEGKLEGKLEGKIETSTSTVTNLIQKTKMSLEEAIYNLGIEDSIKDEVIKQVKLKLKIEN